MAPVRTLLLLLATSMIPAAARAASFAGTWRSPAGIFELKETPEGVTGTLVAPARGCAALAKGAQVLRGAMVDGTFSGEVRVCLEGPECTVKESWLSALLMGDAKALSMSGAIERGNAACHARVPGKGGITLRKVVPGQKPHDARAKLDPKAVAQAQALLADGQKLLQVGNPEEARAKFEAAAALAPLPEAYNGVGVSHYFRHEYDEALEAYRQAIAADPDFGDAYYNMACIYAVTDRKDLAFKFLEMSAHNRYHDFASIDDDPDLASLHADPRYAKVKKLARSRRK